MPIVLTKTVALNTNLYLWAIEESVADLTIAANLSSQEQLVFSTFKNETRKLEWTAIRALLNFIFQKKVEVHYEPDGRPYILENVDVSFSHTQGFVAVIVSENNVVGVDVEPIRDKVLRVKERFLNQNELLSLKKDTELIQVLVYWCLKEVLFKIAPDGNIDFRKDLILNISDDESNRSSFSGVIAKNKERIKCNLAYLKFNNIIIAWGVKIS